MNRMGNHLQVLKLEVEKQSIFQSLLLNLSYRRRYYEVQVKGELFPTNLIITYFFKILTFSKQQMLDLVND